jgi:TrmH family RNA methyltransferase
LSRAEAKRIRGLQRRKNREREGLFLAEGIRVAEDLLASSVDLRLAVISPTLEDTPRGVALRSRLAERCPVRVASESEMAELAATETPQGVLIVAAIPSTRLEDIHVSNEALVLVLDAIQDPGNFGTLVRTAEALGAAAVIALTGTVDPWNPKAVRGAAGSSFRVPIVSAEVAAFAAWARAHRFTIYGADGDGQTVDRVSASPRAALVVGNEGAGLGPGVRAIADKIIAVPIRGRAESLNVGVAAGILLYSLSRGR